MTELSNYYKRKLVSGEAAMCIACGKPHTNSTDKCRECSRQVCKSCNKPFIKGAGKVCNACMRRRGRA